MIKVYCYAKCTTCKKALKWLDDNKIEYKPVDIKEDHPDEKLLRKLYKKSGLPLRKFFNTSGILYRELELSKKLTDMSDDEKFKLLASDGMLVTGKLQLSLFEVLDGPFFVISHKKDIDMTDGESVSGLFEYVGTYSYESLAGTKKVLKLKHIE